MVKRSLFYWQPLILMILIFIESAIPMDGGSDNIAFLTALDPTLQNLLHIPLYGMLAFLWIRSSTRNHIPFKKSLLLAIGITILYGCLDELHQTFVPGRYGGLLDIYLDCVGAVLGIILFFLFQKVHSQFFKS